VINCQNVTMLSSLMLGKLVVLARKATRAGGRLAICNAHRSVTAVLIVSRLVESVSIYPDENSAVAALGASNPSAITAPSSAAKRFPD
jgi:anti-anti-sigma factor